MKHKITKLSDTRYKVETGRLILYIKCVVTPIEEDIVMGTKFRIGKWKVDDGKEIQTVIGNSVEEAIEEYMYSKLPKANVIPTTYRSSGQIITKGVTPVSAVPSYNWPSPPQSNVLPTP